MLACPHCQAKDSIEVCVDAYVVYAFKGFDEGYPAGRTYNAPALRTDEFDDVKVVCAACGEEIHESDFLPSTQAITADDSPLVIKFGDCAHEMIKGITESIYNVTAEIEYKEGVNPDYPTTAYVLGGDDNVLEVRKADEGGAPDQYSQSYGVKYTDIRSITII